MKAWTNIRDSPKACLLKLALSDSKNLVIDNYRKSRTVISIDEEFVSEKLIFQPNISDIDDKKDIALIMSSIQQLKDVERDVIIMRFVEDLSTKEVSEVINKSEGAVKLIQHRAIIRIRKLLENK